MSPTTDAAKLLKRAVETKAETIWPRLDPPREVVAGVSPDGAVREMPRDHLAPL